MENSELIEITNLDKIYPSGEEFNTPVLKGVNLKINQQDFIIIYGPSGCGKSTLLHHIVGLEVPTEGKIIIQGTDITQLNQEERAIFRGQKFGMVYQSWHWAKSLNCLENIAMPLYIAGIDEHKAQKKAMDVMEELQIQKYAQKLPIQLSGGEQQRICIARALVNDPLIIVADEPTGNLDTHNSDLVMQIFQSLNVSKKRTIIMVTHNLIYLPLATRTIAIRDGSIVSSDTEAVKDQIRQELKEVL